MELRLNKEKKPRILEANNVDLEDRWVVCQTGYFIKQETGSTIKAFVDAKPKDKRLQRTRLALCEDYDLERTVLAKTVCYTKDELNSAEKIREKRKFLKAQIELLNALSSHMLPEPLDYFEITNDVDAFSEEVDLTLKESEPVLILDYIPGDVLAGKLQSSYDRTFYRSEESGQFSKKPELINLEMVMRLAVDILSFQMEMYEQHYAYTALTPDHILLLGDNKPRFIGLGRICPIRNDRYDTAHVNFGRQLKGYSAPEMNRSDTRFGVNAGVKANIAYNLGVLIVSIVLSRTEFDEIILKDGAYDYCHAQADRDVIVGCWKNKGRQLDGLLCKLMESDPAKRLTNLEQICQELLIISGDAKKETKKEQIYYGTVKFFARDKGFGYVTSSGVDYRVNLEYIENAPSGYEGQSVAFTVGISEKTGQGYVKAFVKPPRTDVVYPRLVKKPEPQPIPTPVPRPTPAPPSRPTPTSPAPLKPTPELVPPRPEPRPALRPDPGLIPPKTPASSPRIQKGLSGLVKWLFGQ